MRQLAILVVLISTLFVTLVSSNNDELADISPESHHTKLFREIFTQLTKTHYTSQEINDEFSNSLLNAYIERLDSPKRFFLATDIAEFQKWQHKLDDLAKRGDVTVGFYIFNRLRERAIQRLENNIELLENQKHDFDFTINEYVLLDPDDRDWLKTLNKRMISGEKQ